MRAVLIFSVFFNAGLILAFGYYVVDTAISLDHCRTENRHLRGAGE